MADFREWRGLKRERHARHTGQMPVRTTWHGAKVRTRRRSSKQTSTRDWIVTATLASAFGITFAAYDGGRMMATSFEPPGTARIFGFCHYGGGTNCVVDGDTFWMDGRKIRIADIDTPETHPPRCDEEAELGARATRRLQSLLNAGPVMLATVDRDTDTYGRALRIVLRDGQSIGQTLISEGLARPWEGHRRPWCA